MSDNKIKGRPRKGGSHTVHDALLEAARSCLEEKAYHAITIRELAHRAHTNSAMINYYFGSKGNLFVQLVEVMFEDFHQLFQTLNNGPLETSRSPNTALVNALIPFYSKWLNVLRLFSSEAVLYNTNMRAAYKTRLAKGMYLDVRDYLKQMVRRGVSAGSGDQPPGRGAGQHHVQSPALSPVPGGLFQPGGLRRHHHSPREPAAGVYRLFRPAVAAGEKFSLSPAPGSSASLLHGAWLFVC